MIGIRGMLAIALAAVVAAAGCMGSSASATGVLNKVTASGVETGAVGSVEATESEGKVTIKVEISAGSGLTAGEHGVHIHLNPDCGPGPANATSTTNIAAGKAGGHWNPASAKHGQHAGDLGNINVAADGSGSLTVTSFVNALTLEAGDTYNVRGHSVVVHEKKDDGATDPSGNSGSRVLCGVWAA